MRPADQHRLAGLAPVRVAVVTVSDTRAMDTDESGALAARLLTEAGHDVIARVLVKDEPTEVRHIVERWLGAAQVVITNGGTGLAARDSTFEAIDALLEKRLPGFGEMFRALSFTEIGAAAMLSRATAGTARGGVVIALPGSPDAVRLALTMIVLPELGHLAQLVAGPAPAIDPPHSITHVDAKGQAHMVDVGGKVETAREARAQAIVTMSAECLAQLETARKGDVLAVARVAGIQAAKRTSEIIPLCHPVPLSSVSIDLVLDPGLPGVRVTARARCEAKTGVEMEALVAANIAALTVYDMLKAVDREMTIGEVALLSKSGGRSGHYQRA